MTAGRVHYAKPAAKPGQEHWTVCGLFRGFYRYSGSRADVTCGHCRRWLELHPET